MTTGGLDSMPQLLTHFVEIGQAPQQIEHKLIDNSCSARNLALDLLHASE